MNKSTFDISQLLELLRQRSNQGFSMLYDHYSSSLFGIIYKIIKNEAEAENLLQDTFVKIWKNIHQFDDTKGTLFTWMLNIARNTAIDCLRSKNFSQQANNQDLENTVSIKIFHTTSPDIEVIGIKELVGQLKPFYKQAIDLVYFGGYTHEEAAEHLQIPLGTLKTRVKIGIRELKKMM